MDKITSFLNNRFSSTRSAIITIDGFGSSGKTTYSEKLKSYLQNNGYSVIIMHLDDFIHPTNIRYNNQYSEWECYYYLQWRFDYINHNIIETFRNKENKQLPVQLYDKRKDNYITITINFSHFNIMILEGNFIQREELFINPEFAIFINVPKEERLRRALERDNYIGEKNDIIEKYNNRYFPAEEYYEEKYKPMLLADRII
ncbi:MAG: hypothetical protein ACEPOV_07780 [Hyphomicrobiales bacterium]